MNNKPPSMGKPLALAYSAVVAFATAFIIGGIIWDKQANKKKTIFR